MQLIEMEGHSCDFMVQAALQWAHHTWPSGGAWSESFEDAHQWIHGANSAAGGRKCWGQRKEAAKKNGTYRCCPMAASSDDDRVNGTSTRWICWTIGGNPPESPKRRRGRLGFSCVLTRETTYVLQIAMFA
jgi:hypothetical protein